VQSSLYILFASENNGRIMSSSSVDRSTSENYEGRDEEKLIRTMQERERLYVTGVSLSESGSERNKRPASEKKASEKSASKAS
jgi:hypothetical protein